MTFIYELGPVFPEDLPDVQNLTSCVKAFESYRYYRHANRQTDRQTYRHDRNYTPRRFAGGQQYQRCRYLLMDSERQQQYATFASQSGFNASA